MKHEFERDQLKVLVVEAIRIIDAADGVAIPVDAFATWLRRARDVVDPPRLVDGAYPIGDE